MVTFFTFGCFRFLDGTHLIFCTAVSLRISSSVSFTKYSASLIASSGLPSKYRNDL
nr:MAG TPA: hypothetical protein [Caudoviricetes sp.]